LLARPLSLAALFAFAGAVPAPLTAQLTPPSTGGIVALDFLLQRLTENRRVLVVGAHPDDEDTAFLTLAARGYGADAAYLSLCRGEGGQNLIGDELGVGLGLLRTGELAAARSLDGARQFFARAYDFGFSKSLEETNRFWQPDSLLKDVVRVMRRSRPHVVLSIFTGTPRDGHGQHMAAGVVARDAFEAARDPSRFPELESEEGLDPWAPLKLYQSVWFDPASATLELPTGDVEPRSGRSYQQIAMASRSRHRSQDMGRLQPIGPASTSLRLLEDRTGITGEGDVGDALFLGIPEESDWLTSFADSLRDAVSVSRLSDAVVPLAQALVRAERSGIDGARRHKLAEATTIATGLVVDARAESAEILPNQTFGVTVGIHNSGPFDVFIENISLRLPEGWQAEVDDDVKRLDVGSLQERRFEVTVAASATPTQPYYLESPPAGGMYDWSRVPVSHRGLPLQPPQLVASVEIGIQGVSFDLEREVTFRHLDQAIGELRLPVRVVPEVDVKLEPRILVWPPDDGGLRTFVVTIVNNADSAVSGTVGLESADLQTPAPVPFRFQGRGESRTLRFSLARPAFAEQMLVQVRAVVRSDDGRVFDEGVETVSYPHIRPSSMVVGAVANVHVAPVRFPSARNVGYVRGAADRVPEALEQFGLPIHLLTAEDLARADLSSFDAIVVGSRAYETDTALVNHNDRLLSYVERGGHLVVLYQQYQFAAGGFAPYEIDISRPHDRITDESSPVLLLEPDHPAFNQPNPITSEDWEGWPQERGLYFAGTWSSAYSPLLEMADPGSAPVRGGLLVTQYGNGTYVYTGLSFFRAIPAGVVGAYRLFMNLLDLGGGERR
jgi:LmbE family N-acetylglucosaminyl deacetylase